MTVIEMGGGELETFDVNTGCTRWRAALLAFAKKADPIGKAQRKICIVLAPGSVEEVGEAEWKEMQSILTEYVLFREALGLSLTFHVGCTCASLASKRCVRPSCA